MTWVVVVLGGVEDNVMSSCVADIEYDQETRTLVIEFVKGGSYTYHNVPPAVVAGLQQAGSPGRYFNANIRYSY